MNFEDLRGILHYVPQFRERIFVIAFDGAVMRLPNFHSLLQDVAVLQSLNIQVAIVFGARHQVREVATSRGVSISSDDGMGRTDQATLDVSADVISRLTSELVADLTALELRVAVPNALAVHPTGVIEGVDLEHTGRIERVDDKMLLAMLKEGIIPVLPPLGYDGRGATLRLNSDAVAIEVALAVDAAKVIFVAEEGLVDATGARLAQLPVGQARDISKRKDTGMDPSLLSKLRHAAIACGEGVPRVHVIDGRQDEVLLAELFSNEGVGTMIHADDYQQIRKARPSDVPALLGMMRQSVEDAALAPRTREQILKRMSDFFVLEMDGNPVGTVAIHTYEVNDEKVAELACLFVRRAHKNQGHGRKLVAFAEELARERGCAWMFALSTQAFRFFEEKMGYIEVKPDLLPASRRDAYESNGRNSKVLKKSL